MSYGQISHKKLQEMLFWVHWAMTNATGSAVESAPYLLGKLKILVLSRIDMLGFLFVCANCVLFLWSHRALLLFQQHGGSSLLYLVSCLE